MSTDVSVNPAEKAANDLLRAAWRLSESNEFVLPVDPFAIAGRLGLKVFYADLSPDVSGMLAKRPGQDPEVYINRSDSQNRQRFSCAHELGHYVKRVSGRENESWGYIDRRGPSAARGSDPEEIYANQFAAELLMPRELVIARRDAGRDPAAMAIEFFVSLGAMKYRLENVR